ncbi:hypothetical protein K438DRAFT_2180632 [Mycena galopus ATCC 62051]|nr:hypothetical protein K438DRAFT_2180632 [Mycena galopus ATCC 62051]
MLQQVSDSKYLVPSEADPSKFYEVDLDAYTCQCLNYPLIRFCKHLCAVQELFDEPGVLPAGIRPSFPDVSSLPPRLPDSQTPSASSASPSAPPSPTGQNTLMRLVEKFDRSTARLRQLCKKKKEPVLGSLPALEAALDAWLLETDSSSVLPNAQHLEPNMLSQWKKTHKGMMPGVKTKRKPAGDPSYGAGARSGGKAKEPPQKKTKSTSTASTSAAGPPPPSNSLLLAAAPTQTLPLSAILPAAHSSTPRYTASHLLLPAVHFPPAAFALASSGPPYGYHSSHLMLPQPAHTGFLDSYVHQTGQFYTWSPYYYPPRNV